MVIMSGSGEEGRFVAALLDRARDRMQSVSIRAPSTTLRVFRLHGLDHWLVRERDSFGTRCSPRWRRWS
jgi:hypothetical protein